MAAGTRAYMAPEMHVTGYYSQQVDIYSLSKVMEDMATRGAKSVPPLYSQWGSLAQQLMDFYPYKRKLAWEVRDAAIEAMKNGLD